MTEKPKSTLTENVVKRLNDDLIHLGGLTDLHVKMITYYITEKLGFSKFRFEIKYLATPKRFIIHILSNDGLMELYCRPKPADFFSKMEEYLGIKDEWIIEFAKREE